MHRGMRGTEEGEESSLASDCIWRNFVVEKETSLSCSCARFVFVIFCALFSSPRFVALSTRRKPVAIFRRTVRDTRSLHLENMRSLMLALFLFFYTLCSRGFVSHFPPLRVSLSSFPAPEFPRVGNECQVLYNFLKVSCLGHTFSKDATNETLLFLDYDAPQK